MREISETGPLMIRMAARNARTDACPDPVSPDEVAALTLKASTVRRRSQNGLPTQEQPPVYGTMRTSSFSKEESFSSR